MKIPSLKTLAVYTGVSFMLTFVVAKSPQRAEFVCHCARTVSSICFSTLVTQVKELTLGKELNCGPHHEVLLAPK